LFKALFIKKAHHVPSDLNQESDWHYHNWLVDTFNRDHGDEFNEGSRYVGQSLASWCPTCGLTNSSYSELQDMDTCSACNMEVQ
jgi:hypothetical protein